MSDEPVMQPPEPGRREMLFARAQASLARAAELQMLANRTVSEAQVRRSRPRAQLSGMIEISKDALQASRYARLLARLASLPAIEQAKGILMAQTGCSPDEAFDMLRRASQRSNVPVRQLAERIVEKTSAAAADGSPPGDTRQTTRRRRGGGTR